METAGEAPAPRVADLHGARVLVVDDHDDTRDLLRALFESAGAVVSEAPSAAGGLASAAAAPPDLVVADIGMPDVDGYAFLKAFRDAHPGVPSIAVSAYAKPEDSVRAHAAGFDAYHPKPIVATDLLDLAGQALKRRPTGGPGVRPRSDPAPAPRGQTMV